jgi:histidinol-phosphate aminotransferase
VKAAIEVNNQGIDYLRKEFDRLKLDYWPSEGNFLLVKMPSDPKAIYDSLLRQGVIVRPVAGYGLKEHLRFSVGTMAENKRVIESLEKTLKELA